MTKFENDLANILIDFRKNQENLSDAIVKIEALIIDNNFSFWKSVFTQKTIKELEKELS